MNDFEKSYQMNQVNNKRILDACCGSRMFWFNKKHKDVLFMDNRKEHTTLCDGRTFIVKPDLVADFRKMPFADETFYHVVFDPPHLIKAGENSWLATKYGVLDSKTWKEDIKQGFKECMRVLKVNGTLIFKWSDNQINTAEVLRVIEDKPLYGYKRGNSIFLVFIK